MEIRTSKKTAPWRVDEKDFPKSGSQHEKLQFMLRYAILAPSFYNSQPWQFAISDTADQINIYADQSRWLKTADPDKHELYLSLGAALENLLIAIGYFGQGHKSVVYFPEEGNDEWAARIDITTARESVAPRPKELFGAINHRHTYLRDFKNQPLSSKDLQNTLGFVNDIVYEDQGMYHRVEVATVSDQKYKNELVEFVSRSDVVHFSDTNLRKELDGLRSSDQYWTPWLTGGRKSLSADAELGNRVAEQESKIVSSAPVVGILSANYEDATSAVKVGQTFERIALEATLHGVGIYPMFQLLEVPETKTSVKKMFPDLKGFPQLAFAMGYVDTQQQAVELTPRIPLEQVMRHSEAGA
jgi:hypothetical protein